MEGSLIFNSINFLVFFPVVAILYYLVQDKFRWSYLLLVSCIFYLSFVPVYILVLFLIVTIDYLIAIGMGAKQGKYKTFLFIFGILANCSVLFLFKYFNFIGSNLNLLARFIGWNYSVRALSLLLPIGISFYTFQSLSYLIEVYRGNQKAERHYGIYASYIMFFPQLVAGPIGRPQALLPQFRKPKLFNLHTVKEGALLMLFGFFKKVVIADQLSDYVSLVYNAPGSYNGSELFFATILFGIQIYTDFSGYTDIARGAAQILGFSLVENFKMPYMSKSIADFWRRWHMSLMSWFRDYVYIPLGGNRITFARWGINILIVFLVSGLWHGANWTFVYWGLLHGSYIIISRITLPFRNRFNERIGFGKFPTLHSILMIATTYLLINLAWIFFRSSSIEEGFFVLRTILTYFSSPDALEGLSSFLYALLPFLFFVSLYDKKNLRNFPLGCSMAEKTIVIAGMSLFGLLGIDEVTSSLFYIFLLIGVALILANINAFAKVSALMQWFGYFCLTLTLTLILKLIAAHLPNPILNIHILIALVGFGIAELAHYMQAHPAAFPLSKKTILVRWAVYISLIVAILIFGVFENQQFIYMQF